MRVLEISATHPANDLSGVGTLVAELAGALAAAGHETVVWTREGSRPIPGVVGLGRDRSHHRERIVRHRDHQRRHRTERRARVRRHHARLVADANRELVLRPLLDDRPLGRQPRSAFDGEQARDAGLHVLRRGTSRRSFPRQSALGRRRYHEQRPQHRRHFAR